jgi:hypothetical protein
MAKNKELPGWPKQRLVKDVRAHLRSYGIRPQGEAWRATWASAIANPYYHTHWPLPSEIGTQYVLLLLADMKRCRFLKLPYRANTVIPDSVKQLLPVSSLPMMLTDERHRKTTARKTPTKTSTD